MITRISNKFRRNWAFKGSCSFSFGPLIKSLFSRTNTIRHSPRKKQKSRNAHHERIDAVLTVTSGGIFDETVGVTLISNQECFHRIHPGSLGPIDFGMEATGTSRESMAHDDVIKLKHFPPYWPFVRGIHRSPVNSPNTSQWRGALMLSLICTWINGWVNNREPGDLRRHRAHYDVTVMAWGSWGAYCSPIEATLRLHYTRS